MRPRDRRNGANYAQAILQVASPNTALIPDISKTGDSFATRTNTTDMYMVRTTLRILRTRIITRDTYMFQVSRTTSTLPLAIRGVLVLPSLPS